jgi:hypothetical protein
MVSQIHDDEWTVHHVPAKFNDLSGKHIPAFHRWLSLCLEVSVILEL